jgi:hypothetical protein
MLSRGFVVAAGCALALGVFVPAAEAAPTETVTNTNDDGPGSLRAAMTAVDNGGEIFFASAAIDPGLDFEILIDKNVTITGLGAGTTKITGGVGDRIFELAAGVTVTIRDLEITGGNAPGGADGVNPGDNGTPGESGGAILNTHSDSSLTLRRTLIDGNNAAGGGSGVSGDLTHGGGTGAIGGSGGAISSAGTLVVEDSELKNNAAGFGGAGGSQGAIGPTGSGAPAGSGGAIVATGTVSISDSTFRFNSAGDGGSGGAGSTCGAGANGGNGGGLRYNGGGALALTNVTITANLAGSGGAHGSCAMQPNLVGGNGGSGGGVSTSAAAPVTNATIAGNAAGSGSPGTNFMGLPTPPVNGTGGGVSGAATLNNTIMSSNNAPDNQRNCDAAVLDGDYNVSFPDTPEAGCPAGFAHGDPQLVALADNGGRTPTMAIPNTSSAYDHVPTSGAGCPALDQRGVGRPQFASCDAGAFELAPGPPPPTPPPAASPGPTGQRAAALKKCKKKKSKKARKKCKKKANKLPV